jgi:hypothetical protein
MRQGQQNSHVNRPQLHLPHFFEVDKPSITTKKRRTVLRAAQVCVGGVDK